VESPERERRHIVDYFVGQSPEGTAVSHAEKVTVERVYGIRHDVWDVHSSDGRWWVITNPTNLYSQERFPSMDEAFAVHIGVVGRMLARQSISAPVGGEERARLEQSWRRFEQAGEALNNADEAEDFQAVGMRCRETLVTFIGEVADDRMVPDGQEVPKRAQFVSWAELIAGATAHGSRAKELRGYLKAIAGLTWSLVNWLTHAKNATRQDGVAAVDATGHLLAMFTTSLLRFERGETDRCPECGSYQLSKDYDDADEVEFPYCKTCGWEGPRTPWR
jgi:hypothetical protein